MELILILSGIGIGLLYVALDSFALWLCSSNKSGSKGSKQSRKA